VRCRGGTETRGGRKARSFTVYINRPHSHITHLPSSSFPQATHPYLPSRPFPKRDGDEEGDVRFQSGARAPTQSLCRPTVKFALESLDQGFTRGLAWLGLALVSFRLPRFLVADRCQLQSWACLVALSRLLDVISFQRPSS
jgi:hypothetical protein